MEEKTTKHMHNQQHDHHPHEESESYGRLAASATFHCLMGCGIGEVIGMIIGTALDLSNTQTLVLAVLCGFALVAGFCAAYPVNFVMVKRGIRHCH